MIGCSPSALPSNVVGTFTSIRHSSSAAIANAIVENPAPPCSGGMNAFVNPALANSVKAARPRRNASIGSSVSSTMAALSASTLSAKARAFCCSSRSSGERVKSIGMAGSLVAAVPEPLAEGRPPALPGWFSEPYQPGWATCTPQLELPQTVQDPLQQGEVGVVGGGSRLVDVHESLVGHVADEHPHDPERQPQQGGDLRDRLEPAPAQLHDRLLLRVERD